MIVLKFYKIEIFDLFDIFSLFIWCVFYILRGEIHKRGAKIHIYHCF